MSTVFESTPHRFNRSDFARMADAGVFGPEDHVELLDGEIIDMAPEKSRHATAVTLVGDALRAVFAANATLRLQLPLGLDDHSEPEPDIAVVPGSPRDYRDAHPTQALLICEVSDTTLAYDRTKKLAAYARVGIAEYWILDLSTERLEVYREPREGGYSVAQVFRSDESVEPVFGTRSPVAVKDLLP